MHTGQMWTRVLKRTQMKIRGYCLIFFKVIGQFDTCTCLDCVGFCGWNYFTLTSVAMARSRNAIASNLHAKITTEHKEISMPVKRQELCRGYESLHSDIRGFPESIFVNSTRWTILTLSGMSPKDRNVWVEQDCSIIKGCWNHSVHYRSNYLYPKIPYCYFGGGGYNTILLLLPKIKLIEI